MGHGDELTLIFHMEKFPLRQRWSEEDFKGMIDRLSCHLLSSIPFNLDYFSVSSRLLKMRTNFAKQSNPTPEEDSELDYK